VLPGLTQALAQVGIRMSGTTVPPSPSSALLRRFGVHVGGGRRAHWFPRETCLLVHGEDVGREHSARLGALRRGVEQTTPAGWLRWTLRSRLGVLVAGGREAGVTAAMIGWVLTRAGKDPSVFLEHPSPQLGGWARRGDGAHVVAHWPGDPESAAEIGPRLVVLMRVGGDPWDEPASWAKAWRRCPDEFAAAGDVLALGHPSLVEPGQALRLDRDRFAWLSLHRGSQWWGADLREERCGSRFRVFYRGDFVTEVALNVPGKRNVLCALAAVAACIRLEVRAVDVREGLAEFAGVSRDFEPRGSFRGVTLLDDASGELGPVRETVAQARRAFGRRRLWVVFAAPEVPAPGDLRRFRDALAPADRVLIVPCPEADVGRAVPAGSGGGSIDLTRRLVATGVPARWEADVAGALSELDRHLEPGDVLLTLGAGDVGTIADALIRRLPRVCPGG
jgi:UDP-N-acetylmuramate--alanine ligase